MPETDNRAIDHVGNRVFGFVERVDGRYWSTAFFVALFAYTLLLVVTALGYGSGAQLFPLVVGVPLLALIVAEIVILLFPDRLGFESTDLFESTQQLEESEGRKATDQRRQYRREFEMSIWTILSVTAVWLFGHMIGLAVFVFGFIYAYERNAKRALIATVITFIFVYLLFNRLLGANLWEGLVPIGGALL